MHVVLAAAEHQVLEQVRKTGLPGLLVLRAHVIPDVEGHDGGFVILVNDQGETVLEHEFLVGDVNIGSLPEYRPAENEDDPRGKAHAHGCFPPVVKVASESIILQSPIRHSEATPGKQPAHGVLPHWWHARKNWPSRPRNNYTPLTGLSVCRSDQQRGGRMPD
jgi:hypothetical protein